MFADGTISDRAEIEFFQKIDNDFSILLDKALPILEKESCPRLGLNGYNFICQFAYNQMSRSPILWRYIVGCNDVDDAFDRIIKELEILHGPMSEVRKAALLSETSRREVESRARVANLLRQSPNIIDIFKSKTIVWGITEDMPQLIIGDFPFAIIKSTSQSGVFSCARIDAWMPVSSFVAIGFLDHFNGIYPRVSISADTAHLINQAIRAQSSRIAGSSYELVSSLV